MEQRQESNARKSNLVWYWCIDEHNLCINCKNRLGQEAREYFLPTRTTGYVKILRKIRDGNA
nr:unnamed protein product [Callosobruchus analis]